MGTVAFPALTQAEQIFKDLVWDPMLKAGETWFEGAVPFFAFPVVKQTEEELVQLAADWTFGQLVRFVDVTAIRLVNAEHDAAFQSAMVKLRILAKEKGTDSDEFKKAREAAKADLSRFSQFGATRA